MYQLYSMLITAILVTFCFGSDYKSSAVLAICVTGTFALVCFSRRVYEFKPCFTASSKRVGALTRISHASEAECSNYTVRLSQRAFLLFFLLNYTNRNIARWSGMDSMDEASFNKSSIICLLPFGL